MILRLSSSFFVLGAFLLMGSPLPSVKADIQDFAPLGCNSNLESVPCTTGWKEAFGTSITYPTHITIGCGECIVMDHDGPAIHLQEGINILGKLVFPDGYNLEVKTTKIVVQGELVMSATDKAVDGTPSIKITLEGEDEQTFTPADSNAGNCGGGDCSIGKKPIVVAGGKITREYTVWSWIPYFVCPFVTICPCFRNEMKRIEDKRMLWFCWLYKYGRIMGCCLLYSLFSVPQS